MKNNLTVCIQDQVQKDSISPNLRVGALRFLGKGGAEELARNYSIEKCSMKLSQL